MEGIFISYRRDDSAGYAGRLYDRLAAHFGAENVFMDVEGIEPGTDFVKAIEDAVASCRVLIVLIGNQWMATDASGRRRLDDPHDFIRLETSTALARDIRVVPVLVDRAPMPNQEDLPRDLQSLVRRQAVELNHKQWDATSGELIKTLEKILDVTGKHPIERARQEQADDETHRAGPGRTLWIAAAVLVTIAASAAFWKLSVYDEQRAPPDVPSLTGKAGPKAPSAPENAKQHVTQTEDNSKAPTLPELIEPAAEQPVKAGTADLKTEEVDPPTIVSLTSTPEKEGASVCYRVLDAYSLSLTPLPGALGNTSEACVRIALDQATELTLAAEGKGGSNSRSITAAPLPPPPPAAPKVVEKPKPALPPVISSLTTHSDKTGVSICYQAERARRLRLTPTPGDLKNHTKACVSITLEKPTSFTLTATGPGGSASKQITVSPHPGTLARIEQHGKLPEKGESWVYRTQGKWPTSPKWKFRINIERADNGMVSETMAILEPVTKAVRSRSSNGGDAGFISWPDVGLEFSPWMGAYIELSGKESWRDFSTPAVGNWDKWFSSASASRREQIKVQAGSYDAWKLEVWSNRNPTGGRTIAGQEPVRMQFKVWYAPKIKRYVKSERKIIAADGAVLEQDLFELIEYMPN